MDTRPICMFRHEVRSHYKSCMITGFHADECDAAHIIPAYICELFACDRDGDEHADDASHAHVSEWWESILHDSRNGLLLTKTLHNSFDNYNWCFDVFDIRCVDGVHWMPIISMKPRRNILINRYIKNSDGLLYYRVRAESLPYLYIHYYVTMRVCRFGLPSEGRHDRPTESVAADDIVQCYSTATAHLSLYRDDVALFMKDLVAGRVMPRCDPIIMKYSLFNDRYLVVDGAHRKRKWVDGANAVSGATSGAEGGAAAEASIASRAKSAVSETNEAAAGVNAVSAPQSVASEAEGGAMRVESEANDAHVEKGAEGDVFFEGDAVSRAGVERSETNDDHGADERTPNEHAHHASDETAAVDNTSDVIVIDDDDSSDTADHVDKGAVVPIDQKETDCRVARSLPSACTTEQQSAFHDRVDMVIDADYAQ